MKKIKFLLLTLLFLFSCSEKSSNFIEDNIVFSLDLGRLEDQIDVVFEYDYNKIRVNSFTSKNGLFYIGNGKVNKVLELNSYGQLLNIFYNPYENPTPMLLSRFTDESTLSNRNAYAYYFNDMGVVAVNSKRELYIVDRVVKGREEYDKNGQLLTMRLLHFNEAGEAVDYIGQNGIGGTPFRNIHSVSISKSDEISIVSRDSGLFHFFHYSNEGRLLYDIKLNSLGLPSAFKSESNVFGVIDDVFADKEKRLFYIKVDYYSGSKGNEQSSVSFKSSSIWKYSLDKQEFLEGHISLPKVFVKDFVIGGDSSELREVVYDFLGVDASGNIFFLCQTDKNVYNLRVYSRDGKLLVDKSLILNDSNIFYRIFEVSDNGTLHAMLCYSDRVDVVSWDSDRFLKRSRGLK
ncbi:MAG: hypothetical protein JXR63_12775 [Spirochaetales bacterium]|nr:hypothetical protein [Spirochaetales bacterium]